MRMRTDSIRHLWVVFLGTILLCLSTGKEVSALMPPPADDQAVKWMDTLYVRIADSAFIDNSIVFTLKIYRPSGTWNNDDVLGDFDFYFSHSKKAFNGTTVPAFESVLPAMDYLPGQPRKNLLFSYTHFYAGRYGIAARGDNFGSGAVKYNIPVGTWVDLCRVKIPMSNIDQNPRLVWDSVATGAMTAGGNPIQLKLVGNVENNPKSTVKATGIAVMPQYQCQGDDVYLYVRDAITSGKGLTFTWRDSITGETWNELGVYSATSTVKTGSSKNNRYHYEIKGAGDTLVIKNAPGVVDNMFFNCTLHDASLAASMTVDTVVYLRDSVWGYLATTSVTSPSGAKYGMSGFIDTVKKCPDADAAVKFYLFGPTKNELQNKTEFGDEFKVYYNYLDEDQNTKRDSFVVKPSQLLSGIVEPNKFPAGSAIKTNIYGYNVNVKQSGKIWIESIKTVYCNNGVNFPLYDTLFIDEVKGDISYDLRDLSVSVNEKVALDTAMRITKPYQIFLKTDPSPIDGWVSGSNDPEDIYYYNAGPDAGEDTVYYTYKIGACDMKAYRRIEVVESSYLTMKVLFDGPYVDYKDTKDSMSCFYAEREGLADIIFPRSNVGRLMSPYDNSFVLPPDVKTINDINVNGTICDWVCIKLYEPTLAGDGSYITGEQIDSVSAFVLQNGLVYGADGKVLKFKNLLNKKVFIQVKHRNHLVISSKEPILLPVTPPAAGNLVIDFSDVDDVYYGADILVKIQGRDCVPGGDLNNDGVISVADRSILVALMGNMQYQYDLNQDNVLAPQDRTLMSKNIGIYTRLP